MRSRAVRLTLSAIAVGVLAAAAFFIFNTEQQIEQSPRRGAQVRGALARRRAGARRYPRRPSTRTSLAGQSADAWIPKVASLSSEAGKGVDDLRSAAATADARASLMEASATIVEIGQVNRRVVDYLKTEQDVMAADVVYSEAGQKVSLAANHVDAARALEQQGARRRGTGKPPPPALCAGGGGGVEHGHAAAARRRAGRAAASRSQRRKTRGGAPRSTTSCRSKYGPRPRVIRRRS